MGTTSRGFITFDPAVDGSKTGAEYITKDSKQNMELLDTQLTNLENNITNKLKLNNESIQNVNFIRNEIIKDGLANSVFDFTSSGGNRKYVNIGINGDFQIIADYKYVEKNSNAYIFSIGIYSLFANPTSGFGYQEVYGTMPIKYIPYQNGISYTDFSKPFTLVITKTGTTLTVTVNNKAQLISNNISWGDMTNSTFNYSWNTDGQNFSGNGKGILIYNRILTPQEIQHNFSVLNNTSSISKINDYDISTDTDHIQDRTGRVQDTINRVFYKQNCKEFTSNGEAITVNNGMDGYVLSGKIEGQTIKNYCENLTTYVDYNGTPAFRVVNRKCALEANKTYSAIYNVTSFTKGTSVNNITVRPVFKNANGVEVRASQTVTITSIGLMIAEFTVSENVEVLYCLDASTASLVDGVKLVISEVGIYDQQSSKHIVSIGKFGLSSTQAVISNNNVKYSF